MEPVESYKILGVLSISIACLAGVFLVLTWRGDRTMSISQHAAAHKTAYRLFAATLTVVGGLFYIFMWRWFGPTLKLAPLFSVILLVAAICQILTAWVPDTKGLARRVHRITAYTLALLMAIITALLLSSSIPPTIIKVMASLALTLMTFVAILYLFVKRSRSHYLIYQSAYIVSFWAVIIAATYVR